MRTYADVLLWQQNKEREMRTKDFITHRDDEPALPHFRN